MKKKNNFHEDVNEKVVKDTEISGQKFEDLDQEEMDKYQGSGGDDVRGENLTTILTLTSKGGYKC